MIPAFIFENKEAGFQVQRSSGLKLHIAEKMKALRFFAMFSNALNYEFRNGYDNYHC